MEKYFADQQYENIDYTTGQLPIAEYDLCTFTNCNFSNSLLNRISIDCSFHNCNISSKN